MTEWWEWAVVAVIVVGAFAWWFALRKANGPRDDYGDFGE